MQTNSNLSPLPFYQDITEQDYRKWYAYGEKYLHRLPNDYLVPFFIQLPRLEDDEWANFTMEMYRVCECGDEPLLNGGAFNSAFSMAFNINAGYESKMRQNGFFIPEIDGDEYLIYKALPNKSLDLPRGVYYFKIALTSASDENRYIVWSDLFVAEPNINDFIKVEWYNIDNLQFDGGLIPYNEYGTPTGMHNIVYLDTEISMPTYEYTEEGEERNGVFFPTKQISEKVYNMAFVAPEYLCDSLRLAPMADYVTITDRLGRVYHSTQFTMEVEWLEQGHYANVRCSFKTDTIIRKNGKAY